METGEQGIIINYKSAPIIYTYYVPSYVHESYIYLHDKKMPSFPH